jgi:hypothetical protein
MDQISYKSISYDSACRLLRACFAGIEKEEEETLGFLPLVFRVDANFWVDGHVVLGGF